jgi:hypothetical protein
MEPTKEKSIRAIVATAVGTYATTFSERHLREVNNPDGTINMKINNIFIAVLSKDIQYYSALSRSLDSSLGNMLEQMAVGIASLSYCVSQYVEGVLYREQTDYIAEILEAYKSHDKKPKVADYIGITQIQHSPGINKRHESDYYLYDEDNQDHHLIELKIGGDLDNKKARSEKEAILEQYCILSNRVGEDHVKIHFATAYNRYGEGNPWAQSRVLQFFSPEELLIGADFWNFICKSDNGYEIVIDEYKNNAYKIINALNLIKEKYLG